MTWSTTDLDSIGRTAAAFTAGLAFRVRDASTPHPASTITGSFSGTALLYMITPCPTETVLIQLEQRILWLSTAMIDHANRVRANPGGVKVGGHQASSAR
jgi:pyruvate dehydrogenase complex dehydrogenase (E1) component